MSCHLRVTTAIAAVLLILGTSAGGQDFLPSAPPDRTLIYTLDERNTLTPLAFETARTPLKVTEKAKSTKTSYIEISGEHSSKTLSTTPRIFLFTTERQGSHPPFIVWLTPKRGARRATAIAQSGMTGFAIDSGQIVKPTLRVLEKFGDEVFMELRPRTSLVPGEYAIIGDDLTRIATFRVSPKQSVESGVVEEMPEQLKLSTVNDAPRTGFWPAVGIFLICASAGFGLTGCKSGDQTKVGGPGVASSSPAAATNPARSTTRIIPAGPVVLSQEIRDTKVKTLDGGSLKLSDYDNKVVVVNIWATWCGPCRQEMPDLVKLNQEYKSRGLVVLGLATTYNERDNPEQVKQFIKTQNVTYKILWDDGALAGPLVQSVNGKSVIPQSFVISRDGRIVKHFSGFNALQTPTLMRKAVEEALNDKSKA